MKNYNIAALGAGVGLRHKYFSEILQTKPKVNWFEVIVEDFFDRGGKAKEELLEIAQNYSIIGHSVCLSIGSSDPLDFDYLKKYKKFLKEINSPWSSDHLCFTMIDHSNLNELIPLPFTKEAVKHVAERLKIVQAELEIPFLVENVTRYLTLSDREMNEAQFIAEILEKSDCGLLLDLTNVYLNSQYHNYDAWEFINELPLDRVGQIHLAGSEADKDGTIIDSHDAPVPEEVWTLLKSTISKIGKTSVLIERDRNLPPLKELLIEAELANSIVNNV